MKKQLLLSAAVAMAALGFAGSAHAAPVFSASLSNGFDATIGYTGLTLDAATSYTLGASPFGGGIFLPVTEAGSFAISPTTIPTLGLNTANPIDITKTFTARVSGDFVTEHFTAAFVTSRSPFFNGTTNLGLLLEGTITASTFGFLVGDGVSFGIAANQTGQTPGTGAQSWSGNQISPPVPPPGVPLPGAFVLFGSVLAGAGAFMRRRRGAAEAAAA